VAQTGQPYAYTGDNPVNWIDPLGLSWYDPSWVHKAIHRFARGADKVGHFIATHKQAVITAAVIIATLPLDETGLGEAIDADVIGADVTADGTADLVSDEMANEAAEEEGAEAADQEQAADQTPSCGAQSFTPDTEVQLANGAKIPISQVRVGDMVLATDTATGKTQAERVTTLWVNHDSDLMDVTVRTASGTSTIHSTQHHLFWDLNTQAWVQAEHLSEGMALKTPNRATATVVGTTVIPGAAGMWDLTVNNDHDFYVVVSAGSQTAVLVHNCPTAAGQGVPEDSDLGQALGRGMRTVSSDSWDDLTTHLEEHYGITPEDASDNLHSIKSLSEGNPDVTMSWSGDVYDSTSGDLLGNLLDG